MTSELDRPTRHGIPPVALYLGLGGLIPFVLPALSLWLASPAWSDRLMFALLAYGAVILSFLGGVRWGAVLRDDRALATPGPLAWSVTPSLVGWLALLLGGLAGLMLLIAGLAGQYLLDRVAAGNDALPHWYGRLRTVLSTGAITSLLIAILSYA